MSEQKTPAEAFAEMNEQEKLELLQHQVAKELDPTQLEEYLAEWLGIEDGPHYLDEDYTGPMMSLPDGTGYFIDVKVVRINEKGERLATDQPQSGSAAQGGASQDAGGTDGAERPGVSNQAANQGS